MARSRKSPLRLHLIFFLVYILSAIRLNYGLQLEDDTPKFARFADLPGENRLSKELTKKGNGGMWFGPRLGKRSRGATVGVSSSGQSLPLQRLLLEAMVAADPKALEEFPDFLSNSFELTGSKRRFTPRLGRESGEVDTRHVEFVPRLGRELSIALPSSGLASDNEMASIPLLYGRYAAEERQPLFSESGAPPFAPRLGRQLLLDLYNSLGLNSKDDLLRVARSVNSSKGPNDELPKNKST